MTMHAFSTVQYPTYVTDAMATSVERALSAHSHAMSNVVKMVFSRLGPSGTEIGIFWMRR